MGYDTLLFERQGSVARVTLNRPDKLNALNLQLIEDLTAASAVIAADAGIRSVLLTGAGRAFSSGADLTSPDLVLDPGNSLGENIRHRLQQHFNPMVLAWHELRVPLVVAVNGIAAGAGVSLALLGDIVLAARSASFSQLFAPKLGLLPDLGSTFFLPRTVGTARAKGLALLGDALSAADAERWGLIWACVDDRSLMSEAEAIAQRFAAGPTQAYRHIKTIFNRQPASTLSEQLTWETAAQAELADTRDFAEGVQAFRAKRPPNFTGS